MPIYTNKDGVWKEIDTSHVDVGGIKKEMEAIFSNVNGVWKETWSLLKDTFIINPSVPRAEIQKILDNSINGVYLIFEVGDYIFDTGLIIRYNNTYMVGKVGSEIICDYTDGSYLIQTVDTRINNIFIKGLHFNGMFNSGKICGGIRMENVGEYVLSGEDKLVYDSTKIGLTLNNEVGFLIQDCLIRDTQTMGILTRGSGNSIVDNVTIKNATFGFSIVLSCVGIIIKNCKMFTCRNGGITSSTSYRILVEGCYFYNNNIGVTFDENQNSRIVNNTFFLTVSESIRLYNARANLVSSNMIDRGNLSKGILVDGVSKGNNIVGNEIRTCSIGISNLSTATYNYYCGNLLRGNTTQISVTGTGVVNNNNRSVV